MQIWLAIKGLVTAVLFGILTLIVVMGLGMVLLGVFAVAVVTLEEIRSRLYIYMSSYTSTKRTRRGR